MIELVCRVCNKAKPLTELSPDVRCRYGRKRLCRLCANLRMKEQRKKPDSRHKDVKRNSHQKLRKEVIESLGNKCVICNEHRIEFLVVDHVNDDGCIHRRSLVPANTKRLNNRGADGYKVYRDIKKQGYPKDKFQVLCHNCNAAKKNGFNPIIETQNIINQTQGLYGDGI